MGRARNENPTLEFKSLCPCQSREFVAKRNEFPIFVYLKVGVSDFSIAQKPFATVLSLRSRQKGEIAIENNEYLIANLNGKYLVNQVSYVSRTTAGATGNLQDYVIWVSTDGEVWEKVAEGTIENLPGTTTISFTPVEAAYVKLTASRSVHWEPANVNKVMATAEFEVFKAVCEEHTDTSKRTEPTCEEKGSIAYTCSVCGHTYSEEIPALGHTEVIDAAVVPTCTETGLTEGKHCSVCGEVLVARETVDALGHDWQADGSCSRCDEKQEKENPFIDIPADEYYLEPVLWAVGKGITAGTSHNTFTPYRIITRCEAVTFLYRALA